MFIGSMCCRSRASERNHLLGLSTLTKLYHIKLYSMDLEFSINQTRNFRCDTLYWVIISMSKNNNLHIWKYICTCTCTTNLKLVTRDQNMNHTCCVIPAYKRYPAVEWAIPFGFPVDPEVYNINRRSSLFMISGEHTLDWVSISFKIKK